jgi:hypothetical protein
MISNAHTPAAGIYDAVRLDNAMAAYAERAQLVPVLGAVKPKARVERGVIPNAHAAIRQTV